MLYFVVAVVVVVAAALVVLAWRLRPRLAWRWQLVAEKLRGHFPHLSLVELTRVLLPLAVVSKPLRATVEQRGEPPCGVLWRTALGAFWGRETDGAELDTVVTEQVLGIYQRGPVRIRPGDVVLDIGGQLGSFVRVALDRGASKVVTFEPDTTSVACLQKTFSAELGQGRLEIVQAAAWKEQSSLLFAGSQVHEVDGNSTNADAVEVPAKAIDDVVAELGLPRVDFIKMDIEGAERHALAGSSLVLARHRPRLALCVYHLADDPEVIRRLVLEAEPSYREHVSMISDDQVFFF